MPGVPLEERKQLLALRTLAALHPVIEPPANLVARSRMRLGRSFGRLAAQELV